MESSAFNNASKNFWPNYPTFLYETASPGTGFTKMTSWAPLSTRVINRSLRYKNISQSVNLYRSLSTTAVATAKPSKRPSPRVPSLTQTEVKGPTPALPISARKSSTPISVTKSPQSKSRPTLNGAPISLQPRFAVEDALPPVNLLAAGYHAGALDISPDRANEVLRRYSQLYISKFSSWEGNFCEEENITPHTLHLLARILNRAPKLPSKMLAKMLMLSASSLGHTPATIELLKSTLRGGDITREEYKVPLERLKIVAMEGHVDGMALLGKIYELQGQDDAALAMFKAVTKQPPMTTESRNVAGEAFGSSGYAVGEALVSQGLLYLKRDDQAMAFQVFQRAALEEDYAPGYYQLGMLTEVGEKKNVLLLKAAESGIIEACHELGVSLLSKAKMEETLTPNQMPAGIKRDLDMAKEWLSVSAHGGLVQSAATLAQIYKIEGNSEKCQEWMDKAEINRDIENL
jgi:TPR repeat protein